MRSALAAAALSGVAVIASLGDRGGGYVEFFSILTIVALLVAVANRSGSLILERVARVLAVGWDVTVLYALGLLFQFQQIGTSTPGSDPDRFLGIPVFAYHGVAAWGGAALVTLAAFGLPEGTRSGLRRRAP